MTTKVEAGTRPNAGETNVCEWTCPDRCRPSIDLRVDREPRDDGALVGSPQYVLLLLHGHGRLSSRTLWGAIMRQGPGSSSGRSHRLDPDGCLVRAMPDTNLHESPAAQGRPKGEKKSNQRRLEDEMSSRSGKLRAVDESLLMGVIGRRSFDLQPGGWNPQSSIRGLKSGPSPFTPPPP